MTRKFVPAILVVLAAAVWVNAQTPPDTDDDIRFAAVDVFIDSGDLPLAAYQFELTTDNESVAIVGAEGGEHRAFNKERPPYYDPKALHAEGRIIIADYSTEDDLPTGRTRVARVMVQIEGEPRAAYSVKLIAAASNDGQSIDATATATEGNQP